MCLTLLIVLAVVGGVGGFAFARGVPDSILLPVGTLALGAVATYVLTGVAPGETRVPQFSDRVGVSSPAGSEYPTPLGSGGSLTYTDPRSEDEKNLGEWMSSCPAWLATSVLTAAAMAAYAAGSKEA